MCHDFVPARCARVERVRGKERERAREREREKQGVCSKHRLVALLVGRSSVPRRKILFISVVACLTILSREIPSERCRHDVDAKTPLYLLLQRSLKIRGAMVLFDFGRERLSNSSCWVHFFLCGGNSVGQQGIYIRCGLSRVELSRYALEWLGCFRLSRFASSCQAFRGTLCEYVFDVWCRSCVGCSNLSKPSCCATARFGRPKVSTCV